MKEISWSVSEAPRVLEGLPALVCNYPHDTPEIVWEASETATPSDSTVFLADTGTRVAFY